MADFMSSTLSARNSAFICTNVSLHISRMDARVASTSKDGELSPFVVPLPGLRYDNAIAAASFMSS